MLKSPGIPMQNLFAYLTVSVASEANSSLNRIVFIIASYDPIDKVTHEFLF